MILTKHVRDLYAGNNKALMNEIKDLNKWRDTLYSQVGKIEHIKNCQFSPDLSRSIM